MIRSYRDRKFPENSCEKKMFPPRKFIFDTLEIKANCCIVGIISINFELLTLAHTCHVPVIFLSSIDNRNHQYFNLNLWIGKKPALKKHPVLRLLSLTASENILILKSFNLSDNFGTDFHLAASYAIPKN